MKVIILVGIWFFIFGILGLVYKMECKIWLLIDVLVVNLLIDCSVFGEMKMLCNVFENL